jgi:hypothetical protein
VTPLPAFSGAGTDADAFAVRWLAQRWAGDVALTPTQRRRLRRSILRIGAALGVVDEVHDRPFEPSTVGHQVAVVAHAVDRLTWQLIDARAPDRAAFAVVATDDDAPVPGLCPAALVDRLDVNAADRAELDALPGLGPVSARRVVAHREVAGPYGDLDQVRRASGVSSGAFERAAIHLTVGDGRRRAGGLASARLIRRDGLAGLVAGWQRGDVELPDVAGPPVGQVGELLVTVVGGLARDLRSAPLRPRLWAPSRARLRRGQLAARRDEALSATAATDAVRVGPVFSAGYLPMLLALCARAQESIQVSMFYFTAGSRDEDARHPGEQVVAALAAAVARGVEVQIVLDDDLPDDYHGAHAVNAEAADVLAEHAVPVRRAHLDATAHAKAVVVDRRFVLMGSHNWTASSFFRYQETSCLIDSAEFGARVGALLARRWAQLAPAAERVVPVEHLESLTGEQRAAVIERDLTDGPAFVAATRLPSQRERLQPVLGVDADGLDRVRRVVALMQDLPIGETAAVALVDAGIDTPSEVRRSSSARLGEAFADLSRSPEPFCLRRLLPGFADWLAEQED